MRAALVLLALAACGDPPPFTLQFRITQDQPYTCPTDPASSDPAKTCADVTITCDATLNIRIFPPGDPTAPYLTTCRRIFGRNDACAIASVELPPPVVPVPEQRLRVQMMLYPTDLLPLDVDGNPICPPAPPFADDGFPVAVQPTGCDHSQLDPDDPTFCWPVPSIAGSAIYNPGDTQTVVSLGCTDIGSLRAASCSGAVKTAVKATVIDFDTLALESGLATDLAVSVGEPVPAGAEFKLNPTDTRQLPLTSAAQAAWGGDVDLAFQSSACLEVFEDNAQSTATLRCVKLMAPDPATLDFTVTPGVRLAKSTLVDVLNAIKAPQFPDTGLVIGLVLDQDGNPVPPNQNVMLSLPPGPVTTASISYLSQDRSALITGGTSSNGIFVSTDAPYGTQFSARNAAFNLPATGFGGIVDGKVTIVILQFSNLAQ